MKLWVDDERPAPDDRWYHAETSAEAIEFLETIDYLAAMTEDTEIFEVSLDHDLGYSDELPTKYAGKEDTGMKVLYWMIENEVWPKMLTIHTMNPVGRDNMLRAANASAPGWVEIYVKTW